MFMYGDYSIYMHLGAWDDVYIDTPRRRWSPPPTRVGRTSRRHATTQSPLVGAEVRACKGPQRWLL